MNYKVKYDCVDVDFNYVSQILEKVSMAHYDGDTHKKAFENSHTVVFILDNDEIIGFGRAISDGAYQAAIYDVAVLPKYQGKGIGNLIINSIIKKLPQCSFILYASPGKEVFYEKLGFRRMKTGMALFTNVDSMKEKGFTE